MATLPTFRQLGYLVELSEHLNFRAAAEAQYVTQSTLSAGIKDLETVLGVQLVERDRRHVRMTDIGKQVVARARALLAAAHDLTETARTAAGPLTGPLSLGAIPTIAPYLLPKVLPPLRDSKPELQLLLREDLTDRLLTRMHAGELDVALIALPYDTGDLYVRELFDDDFWFVCRREDPAGSNSKVSVRRIDTSDVMLLEEGHCLRDHAIAACGTRREAGSSIIEATSLLTLIQMVEGGLGVTLLPEITIKSDILKGTNLIARPFKQPAPTRTLALVARRTSSHRRDADLIADVIIEQRKSPGQAA